MNNARENSHVVHVSHTTSTGMAHCIAQYVQHLVEQNFRVTVVCPGGRLGDLAQQAGAEVVLWRARRRSVLTLAKNIIELRKILQNLRPDIVHLHGARAGLVGRLLIRGNIPTVFSPHAWSFLAYEGTRQRLVREWERLASRWTTTTLCVSKAEAATARRNGIQGRIAVLPNYVDVADLAELAERYRTEVRTELGISPGKPVAVIATQLTRQKGQDIAISAWSRVREEIPTAELVVIGEGLNRLEAKRLTTPGIRFTGLLDRETTLRWMFAADVVMCPSRWEGMSLVPLEAMALGRPVIASDVDGIRESIPDGAGWLVSREDPVALAEIAIKVLSNPAIAFDAGQYARTYAVEVQGRNREFSALEKLVNIYCGSYVH